ncbi:SUMO1 sentrin specific peptidase 8 [Coemansia sp. BCRC 34301]|nr:SUMO1 sentrin specific peptidase 8 [Coemansia sp. BCRC 34301]
MTVDAVLLDFENAEVRTSDFESLKPEGWLTGEIINFYWTYLERREFRSEPALLFLGTYTAYRISNAESSSVTDSISTQLSGELGGDRQLILIPLNHRSHWSLLVYCRPTRTFYHYDSINRHNRSFAERAAGRFLRVLEPRLKEGFYFKSVQTPQQNNDFDCGVYVLTIAEELARRYVKHLKSRERDDVYRRLNKAQENITSSSHAARTLSSAPMPPGRALASDLLMPKFGSLSFSGFRSPFVSSVYSSDFYHSPPPHCAEPATLRGGGCYRDVACGGDSPSSCKNSSHRSREDRLRMESEIMERAGLPRDFWLVTVEDIEYPHSMRRRIRALVLDLQRANLKRRG